MPPFSPGCYRHAGKDLNDTPVVVTRASSGIGKTIAQEAAERGARVALVARRKKHLVRIADRLNAKGGDAAGFDADSSDPAAVKEMAIRVRREMSIPDILVKNPGAEEKSPKAQGMIRVLTPREAGRAIIDGIRRKCELVAAPIMLRLVLFQARCFPELTRQLMRVTGHRQAA